MPLNSESRKYLAASIIDALIRFAHLKLDTRGRLPEYDYFDFFLIFSSFLSLLLFGAQKILIEHNKARQLIGSFDSKMM